MTKITQRLNHMKFKFLEFAIGVLVKVFHLTMVSMAFLFHKLNIISESIAQ